MNRSNRTSLIGLVAAVLLCSQATAATFLAPSVTFAPGIEQSLQAQYGAQEIPALRTQIFDSVSAALKSAADKCALTVEVVVERVAPSHPTLHQQLADPSLDPFRTRFANGGAALTGHLRGADGHELATVRYQRFNDDLRFTAAGKDPWSDAGVTIAQFADKLVNACEHPGSVGRSMH